MTDDPTRPSGPPGDGPGAEPRVLGGRYEIGDLVGRGGMADVHVGHDLRLGRTVAIKILRTDLARDSSFLARFRREAQSAAGLSHPAIVGVFDSGEEPLRESGGAPLQVPYIVMEFVEGKTLRELLNERRRFEPDEAARVTAAVLAALEYAHDRGLVHRDIKPANVMVTPAGAVKVMDFGIARALADTAATMTQTQAVMGTARYLSPEQAQGLDVDGRSDLYSAGCLLYELLAGRTPFQGDPVALVYQHLGEAPKAPSSHTPSLPEALDAITLHSLEKKPEERYQSAGDFRADLNAARAQEPISDDARQTYRRVIGPAAVAGAGAGAAAAAAAARAGRRDDDPDSTEAVAAGAAGGAAGAAAGGYEREPRPQPDDDIGLFAGDPGDDDRFERTDELPVRERRHPGAAMLLGALAVVALAGLAWVLFQVMGPNGDDNPELVVVPSTVGSTEAQARTELTSAGFVVVDPAEQRSSDEEVGTVLEQTPPGGERAAGSEVRLVVSSGPDAVAVPRIQGMEEQSARDALERAGFTNVREDAEDSDDPDWDEGQVISSNPSEGEEVEPDTEIVLTVATGDVEVPDVVGLDQNQAVVELDRRSLEASISVELSAEAAPGVVLSQSVEGEEVVEQGSTIELVVAGEPVQTQTATTTATATVTVTPEPTEPEPTEPEPTEPEPTEPEPTEPEPTEPEPTEPEPTNPEPSEPGEGPGGPGNGPPPGIDPPGQD
ncbi:Stk1 family PASTA domain-containing Ser/Thr kinase [Serinicoccus sp. LYQ131]|uniref:Stk1 family PASTA domain-containing Ser/Thr kinase n=1 Tax=Serinicoccus sp. LYQ131 TaxID=3378797 RepID=UPI00385218AB